MSAYNYYLKLVTEIYNDTLKSIDGITTGSGIEFSYNGREYKVYIWNKVKKNLIPTMFKTYWDKADSEILNIGEQIEFEYSEYNNGGVIRLNGKEFKDIFRS